MYHPYSCGIASRILELLAFIYREAYTFQRAMMMHTRRANASAPWIPFFPPSKRQAVRSASSKHYDEMHVDHTTVQYHGWFCLPDRANQSTSHHLLYVQVQLHKIARRSQLLMRMNRLEVEDLTPAPSMTVPIEHSSRPTLGFPLGTACFKRVSIPSSPSRHHQARLLLIKRWRKWGRSVVCLLLCLGTRSPSSSRGPALMRRVCLKQQRRVVKFRQGPINVRFRKTLVSVYMKARLAVSDS
ncbi:hypothetical protein BS78_01G008200 [Paspalum vaginatum]|nr:hypothetical protein BS78_01G008200 [Paspalum vaginatum]